MEDVTINRQTLAMMVHRMKIIELIMYERATEKNGNASESYTKGKHTHKYNK